MNPMVAVTLVLQVALPSAVPPESAEAYRRAARRAEAQYESLARHLAPRSWGGGWSQPCDEVVGRFCLRYEDDTGGSRPIAPEAERVIRARQEAIEALRKALAAMPDDFETAGPLVRYLIEDRRADEAVSAAELFAWATPDSAWGNLLHAFALHAAGRDSAAERYFAEGLARLDPETRQRFTRVDFLLAPPERRRYRDLSEQERAEYEARLWTLADPLYLTPGNESWAEHLARQIWARLLARAPRVLGMHSWARDLDELTTRYGVPVARERIISTSIYHDEFRLVERYDTAALAYVPEALHTRGFPRTPLPDAPWELDDPRARSGYAPITFRRLVPLVHQVSRFPAGDSVVLRVDGVFVLDSAASGATSVEAAFFVLDEAAHRVREPRETVQVRGDTAWLSFEVKLPAGQHVYSLETMEPESRLAGRARYSVELEAPPASGPALSDVLVTFPFGRGTQPTGRDDPAVRPRADLRIPNDGMIGIYAEAHDLRPDPDGTTRYRVELVVQRATPPPFPSRALRWLGERVGLSKPAQDPRLAWEAEGVAGEPAILTVDLDLSALEPGLYALELAVTDLVTGTRRQTERILRLTEPRRRAVTP